MLWMKRFSYSVIGLLLFIIVLIFLGRWWLLGTNSGASFVLKQTQQAMGSTLAVNRHHGSINDGLVLNDVSYQVPGTSVEIQQLNMQAELNLLPWPNVQVQRLQIDNVVVELSEVAETSQTAEPSSPPNIASPIAVQLDELLVNHAVVKTGAEAEPFQIDKLQAQLNYFGQLDLQKLYIDLNGIALNANGESALALPFEHELALQLNNNDAPWLPELRGLVVDIHSQGSTELLNIETTSSGAIAIKMDATIRDVLESPSWRLTLNQLGQTLSWPLGATQPDVQVSELLLTSSGDLQDHVTNLNASLDYPEVIRGEWQIQTRGDLQQLLIEEFSGPVLQGRIAGTGVYALQPGESGASFSVQIQDIKPNIEQSELSDLPGVSGTFDIRLDDQLVSVDSLDLRVPSTDWQVIGNSQYSLDSQQLLTDLNWQKLSWPPQQNSVAQFTSREGHLKTEGVLTDLAINLSTEVDGQNLPNSVVNLLGQLGEAGFAIQVLTLETLGGEVDIQGDLSWANGLDWDVVIQAEQVNPGLQWPDFPGSINFQAVSHGSQVTESIDALMDIQQLSGELRGQPVNGKGQIRYVDGSIKTDGLQLRSGDAQFDLQGDELAIQAELLIPRLGDVVPGAQGHMAATIHAVSMNDEAMQLDNLRLLTELKASDLQWSDSRIASLSLNSESSTSLASLLASIKVNATDIQFSDQLKIDSIDALVEADDDLQQLQFDAELNETNVSLNVNGHWNEWPSPSDWQGIVDELVITNPNSGQWALGQPAELSIASQNISLDSLCLESKESSSSVGTRVPSVCIGYQQQAVQQVLIDLNDLPLSIAEAFLDSGLHSDHRLSGQLQAHWAEGLKLLDGVLQLSPGTIQFLGREAPPLEVDGGQLQLSLVDEHNIRTQWQLTIENDNSISGDLVYNPISETDQLNGYVKLAIPNLDWLQKPVPELDGITGALQLNAELSGPLRQPLIALDITLVDSEINYQPLGLQVRDLQLIGHSEPGETLLLSGGFMAGQGTAELKASLEPATGVASLTIVGDSLQLLNSEAIKVKISPDVQLTASPEGYQIAGELHIPAALITPPEGTASRVKESEDVVLVGEQHLANEEQTTAPITGQLKLVLGDSVRVDADVLETHLRGELDLSWDHQMIPQANGAINLVDGVVQAYGQTLTLENSRVLYNKTPVDNPRLDIRAIRSIFGDPQVDAAGVAITGLAQEPKINIYTSPVTNEESAFAYLVTGSNFDHANGQGALNLGIYLLPKLFVSYGLGLFDNGNTANTRYEFSDSWNVSLQSGTRDTGVDLNWRKDN